MPFSVRYSSSASVVESGFTVEVVEVASPTASFFVPVRRADGALAWGPVVVSCVRMRVQARPRFTPALVEFFFFIATVLVACLLFGRCGRVRACLHVPRARERAEGGGAVGGGGGRSKEPIADRAVAQRCFFVYDGLLGVCLRLGCELLHRREY